MKKVLIVFGIILIVGIVVCGVGLIILDSENLSRELITTAQVTDVNEVSIDVSYDNILVVKSETDKFYIEYYSDKFQEFTYSFTDGKVNLKSEKEFFIDLFSLFMKKDIVIYLPETFDGVLSLCDTSGNIKIVDGELDIQQLSITLTSGTIIAENITADAVNIVSTSGDIKLDNISCDNLNSVKTSGKTTIIDSKIKDAKINFTSGEINLDDCQFDNLKARGVSGSINGKITVFENVDCNTTSGSIKLSFNQTIDNYTINYSGTSGDLRLYKNETLFNKIENNIVYGEGDITINFVVTSGNVTLTFIG